MHSDEPKYKLMTEWSMRQFILHYINYYLEYTQKSSMQVC